MPAVGARLGPLALAGLLANTSAGCFGAPRPDAPEGPSVVGPAVVGALGLVLIGTSVVLLSTIGERNDKVDALKASGASHDEVLDAETDVTAAWSFGIMGLACGLVSTTFMTFALIDALEYEPPADPGAEPGTEPQSAPGTAPDPLSSAPPSATTSPRAPSAAVDVTFAPNGLLIRF